MRILLEPGSYTCLNLGDVAMMQMAFTRLSSLWPDTRIQIITESPCLLAELCPEAVPIPVAGKRAWLQTRILGRFHRSLRYTLGKHADTADAALRHRMPGMATRLLAWKMRVRNLDFADVSSFLDAFLNADLVVVSGSGAIADPFCDRALQLMETLAMAHQLKIPSVMFSQGLGPVDNARLVSAMKQVLPDIRQIGVRESMRSPKVLTSAGVAPARICEAGDDALEMALDHASGGLGKAIGINLRMTAYSELTSDLIPALRTALSQAAHKYQAVLIPLPILRRNEEDLRATRSVLPEAHIFSASTDADTPCKAIRLTSCCRLVITSSYHAAVFALGQGIPAIGLVRSQYYANKFEGLRQQFGEGCRIVDVGGGFTDHLSQAIEWAWHSAPALRTDIVETARDLVSRSQRAYRQLPELLSGSPRQVA
jgi:polysaccharide pyruvyl transferase WcaK-like protein